MAEYMSGPGFAQADSLRVSAGHVDQHDLALGATAVTGPVVTLACTACQLVYEPDLAAFGTGQLGCPRCGGWTWIAQLGTGEWTATTSTDRAAAQPRAVDSACPDLGGHSAKNARTGSGSPTTSR
jgi:hypothetical protein